MLRILIATLLAAFAFAAHAAVEVNKANQAELESIKGIGPALSGKILGARKSGEFKNWTDLVDRVGGVGPGNAAKFSQAGLTVNSVAYSTAATPVTAPATKTDNRKADNKVETAPVKATTPR